MRVKRAFRSLVAVFSLVLGVSVLCTSAHAGVSYYNGVVMGDALDKPAALTLAPGGETAYVGVEKGLSVFALSVAGPELIQTLYAGADTPAIDLPSDILVSPDGAYLYLASATRVSVFARAADGRLTLLEQHTPTIEGDGGAAWWPSGLALSPDGSSLYVTGSHDDAVAVFARDGATGRLTALEKHTDDQNGVDGLDGATGAAVSADGQYVFVAGGAEAGGAGAIAVFARDGATGTLSFVRRYTGADLGIDIGGARSPLLSPDGVHLLLPAPGAYALHMLRVSGGALTHVDSVEHTAANTLSPPLELATTADGGYVYVASSGFSGGVGVAVIARDAGAETLAFLESHAHSDPGIEGLTATWGVALAPDEGRVYAIGLEDDALVLFDRNVADGLLTFDRAVYAERAGLDGAYAVATSPDGASVYACGYQDGAVVALDRDPDSGRLAYRGGYRSVPGGVSWPEEVVVAPDGNHLYVVGRGSSAQIDVFSRNAAGDLARVASYPDQAGPGITASGLAMDGAGAFLYVVSAEDDSVSVYQRNAATGELAFLEAHRDGAAGVDGLDGAEGVEVAPDGAHVYVAGATDNAIAVFERGADGRLSFVEAVIDDTAGVDGIAGIRALAVSPDGRHVYAGGPDDNAVAGFARGADGRLTPLQTLAYDSSHWGIWSIYDALVHADGEYVFFVGFADHSLVAFRRDPASGLLEYAEWQADNFYGTESYFSEGLRGAHGLAASPDGLDIYVASYFDDAVSAFRVRPGRPVPRYYNSTDETGATATVQLMLNRRPDAEVSFSVASSDTGEGSVSPAGFTFTPADWNVPQTLTVAGVDDAEDDGDQVFEVTFGAMASADATFAGYVIPAIGVTNVDDDEDADGDGVLDGVEAASAPNGGDGNDDGTPDADQSDVASLMVAGEPVTVVVAGGCSALEAVRETDLAGLPADAEWLYPYGLVDFTAPCSAATVTLYYHARSRWNGLFSFRKWDGSAWIDFDAQFGTAQVGGESVATVTLALSDGGPGDLDPAAGSIRDPGGPAFPVAAVPAPAGWVLLWLAGLLALVGGRRVVTARFASRE